MDISKGRKSTHIEDRTTPLGDLFYSTRTRLQHEGADGPVKMKTGSEPTLEDINRLMTAIRYYKLKTGIDPEEGYFRALLRGEYRPSEVPGKIGGFVRNANPEVPESKPLSTVAAAHLPWQEDQVPLNRDEGRIFTHTGPGRRR